METQFISWPMSKREAAEIYRSLMMRYVMECFGRQERQLESPQYPASLERLESLLGISEDEAHRLLHEMEDELWEHSWYAYTDEWAWFRSRQETMAALGAKAKQIDPVELDRLMEKRYEEKFERYVNEIDMSEGKTATEKSTTRGKAPLKEKRKTSGKK